MAKLIVEYDSQLNKVTKTLEYRGIHYNDNSEPIYIQIARDFILPTQVYNAIRNIDNVDIYVDMNEIKDYEKLMK